MFIKMMIHAIRTSISITDSKGNLFHNGNGSANGMNHHFDEHVQACINEDSRVCGV
jgi:hypothetical protein